MKQTQATEVYSRRVDSDVRDAIIVQSSPWQGTLKLDVRHHSDSYGPLKKGINLPFEDALALVQAIVDVINLQNQNAYDKDTTKDEDEERPPIVELIDVESFDDGLALGRVHRTGIIYDMAISGESL